MKLVRIACSMGLLTCVVSAATAIAEPAAPSTAPSTQSAALSYRLTGNVDEWDADKRERIVKAMDAAVALYNQHGHFPKKLTVQYSPGTPTADGNYNGNIRFGGQIGYRTALHEIGHTLGIGTHPKWREFIKDGKWTGEHALAQLREFDGPDAVLHADRQHFWPYGLNFDREGGDVNSVRHVKMIAAFRRDLGIDAE